MTVELDPRLKELFEIRRQAQMGGGEKRVAKQHAKGKLTARERVHLLLDEGTFNELEPFVRLREDELGRTPERFMGDGVITGYGQIDGRTVFVYSQDFIRTRQRMEDYGIRLRVVDISELRKAEAGITCCSVIFNA